LLEKFFNRNYDIKFPLTNVVLYLSFDEKWVSHFSTVPKRQ